MSKSSVTTGQYINEHQVAEITGVKVSTLRKWRWLSVGPRFRRFGSCVRYSLIDVQEWIEMAPAGGGRAQPEIRFRRCSRER